MKAIFTPTFEIDVSDWYEDERLTKKEKIERLKEELSDFSVFMLHAEYQALKDVKVVVVGEKEPPHCTGGGHEKV